MAVIKYRVSLKGLPPQVLTDFRGRKVLRLIIPSKGGRTDVAAFEGLIIKTTDPLCQKVLDEYRPPRPPQVIRHHKDGTTEHKTWKYDDYKDLRPFKRVGANMVHHIEL
jgi:hypothetical protein